MPFDDSPHSILTRCRQRCIPVNTLVPNAIAAHRIAYFAHQQNETDADVQRVAFYALHAIVLAAAQTDDDHRSRLDYLSEMPETAWEPRHDQTAATYRDETLAMLARRAEFCC
jgi:hypothetical protein